MFKKITVIFLCISCTAQAMERKRTLRDELYSTQQRLREIDTQIESVRRNTGKQACCFCSAACLSLAAWRWARGTNFDVELILGLLSCSETTCRECCDEKPKKKLPQSLYELRQIESILTNRCQSLESALTSIELQKQ